MSNRRIVIRLKMCYTISVVLRLALCKAVCKADRHSEPMLAGIFPIGPDRKGVLFYQAFYIWRGFSIGKTQEMAAGFVHSGIIHLERMLDLFAHKVNPYLDTIKTSCMPDTTGL